MKPIVQVRGVSKRYRIGAHRARYGSLRESLTEWGRQPFRALLKKDGQQRPTIWALKNVTFDVMPGEVVGIIGRNGAGKSTLLKVLSRITEPTEGEVDLFGRVGSLLDVGTGFHPELTGRENIFLNAAILGMKRAEIDHKFDEIVAFAEIEKFLDTPVKHYSSGMYVRLAFAVAAHLEPEILLVDEVLAVGDAAFQEKCLRKMEDVVSAGRAVLFVTHNMRAVTQLCSTTLVLHEGQVVFAGDPAPAIQECYGRDSATAWANLHSASRFGGGHAESVVSGVCYLDANGNKKDRFLMNERLRVRVYFSIASLVKEFDIAMAVVQADGLAVFSEALSDQQPRAPLAPGDYQIDFLLELKYLKLEPYFLTLYILAEGQPVADVSGVSLPEIYDPSSDPFKEAHRWGVVRIPVAWEPVEAVRRD